MMGVKPGMPSGSIPRKVIEAMNEETTLFYRLISVE